MTRAPTPYETAARRRKAMLLAEALKAAGATSDSLDALGDDGWANAEKVAGVNPASDTTREQVRSILAGMEMAEAEKADPFRGFPKLV